MKNFVASIASMIPFAVHAQVSFPAGWQYPAGQRAAFAQHFNVDDFVRGANR